MPRTYVSDQQAEAMMVPKLVEAIYPVLIPMEQQDCRIQAENHKRMTDLATALWRSFVKERAPKEDAGRDHRGVNTPLDYFKPIR